MKKKAIIITIYLFGVLSSWIIGFNNINNFNKKLNRPMTYGDIALTSVVSAASWVGVAMWYGAELFSADFWDKPISYLVKPQIIPLTDNNNHQQCANLNTSACSAFGFTKGDKSVYRG